MRGTHMTSHDAVVPFCSILGLLGHAFDEIALGFRVSHAVAMMHLRESFFEVAILPGILDDQ